MYQNELEMIIFSLTSMKSLLLEPTQNTFMQTVMALICY